MNIEERWVNVEPLEELETIPLDEKHLDLVTRRLVLQFGIG